MNLSFLSKFTKALLGLTALIVLYSFLCRVMSIFFFWESSIAAQWLIYLSLFFLLRDWKKREKKNDKSALLPKILTGVLVFVIFITSTFAIALPFTQAYDIAIADLKNDMAVEYEVGKVQSIVYRCRGAIQISSDFKGTSGTAEVMVIVKGDKAFKDYDLSMVLSPQTGAWTVVHVE